MGPPASAVHDESSSSELVRHTTRSKHEVWARPRAQLPLCQIAVDSRLLQDELTT
jgi:hypothetical protein